MGHSDFLWFSDAERLDVAGSFDSDEVEELLQRGAVVAGFGPHEPAGVVIDDDYQLLGAAPVGDLVDPDPGHWPRPALLLVPTVRHETRINSTTAVFDVWVTSQAT